MDMKQRQLMQTGFSDFCGAGSIIKPLKIACYCGDEPSCVPGPIQLIRLGILDALLSPQ
jgi:hypothetical protein